MAHQEDLYDDTHIGLLEMIWGEGWLSPGGPEEVDATIAGIDFSGKTVLDIGCGTGGIDFYLVEKYHAGHITAIDVEAPVLETARTRQSGRGLDHSIEFVRVDPGPLPFEEKRFDIVFSKDSIIHIPDKDFLMTEAFRVLKPGGWFVASDWLLGKEGPISERMQAYIDAEGLDFGMATPLTYQTAMRKAGFVNIRLESRNAWYRDMARRELMALRGEIGKRAAEKLGQDFLDKNIATWEKMIEVLDSGEHAPHHLRGQRPGV